jgi:hypothetical protein
VKTSCGGTTSATAAPRPDATYSPRIARLLIPALIVAEAGLAACERDRRRAIDPRLDVALVARADVDEIVVPGLILRRLRAGQAADAARVRELAGARWWCQFGSTPDRAELGRATCAAVTADGDRLVIPFAPGRGMIAVGGDAVAITPASASEPTDAATAVAQENRRLRRTDLRVVDSRPAPGGFAAIVATGDGTFEPTTQVWSRLRIAGHDLACGTTIQGRADPERSRAICLALRAP